MRGRETRSPRHPNTHKNSPVPRNTPLRATPNVQNRKTIVLRIADPHTKLNSVFSPGCQSTDTRLNKMDPQARETAAVSTAPKRMYTAWGITEAGNPRQSAQSRVAPCPAEPHKPYPLPS